MAKKVFAVLLILSLVAIFISPLPTTVAKSNKVSLDFSAAQLEASDFVDVIVELQDEPVITYELKHKGDATLLSINESENAKSYEKMLSEKQISLYTEIKNLSSDAKVGYRYQFTFNGFALKVRGKDITKIAELKSVRKIYSCKIYHTLDAVSNSVIGADKTWEIKDSKGNPVDGTGITIAIIDTGVDYKHPDLGGGFGPNYKVIGGYDFGDNDTDPMDSNGHGTHVAGIAAADGQIKGVAPKAKILAYKIVKGDEGNASSDSIIAAVERAVKDGANVINLSFGEAGGSSDPEDPENKAFNNAADAGVLSSVAAGNDGSRCQPTPYPISRPSTASKVISVAASDDGAHPSLTIVSPDVPNANQKITGNYADLSPKFPFDQELGVVLTGFGRKSDFANVDVKGKIALVNRGPIGANAIYFRDKDLNAKEAGALGIIIYNNMPGIVNPTFAVEAGDESREYIPAIFVTQNDGLALKNLLSKGLKIKFGEVSELGTIAEFSSMGPSADLSFKSEISAPGVSIYSTIPGGKYASWNGTSMAAPHVAGAIALVKQLHPDWSSQDIKAAFMNTATVLNNYENGETISWTLQGSGRIDIIDAINTKGIIKPYDLIMKADNLKSVEFTVSNTSSDTVTYNLTSELTLSDFVPATTSAITVTFSPSKITLNKGEQRKFTVTFKVDKAKLPKGANEGLIWLDSGDQKLHIPFIIWNGDVEIPEKLSLVNVSSSTISPGTSGSTMNFDFVLRSGSLTPGTEPNDKPKNSNIIDEMIIKILDTNGKELGVVYSRSLVLLGHYSIEWDGHDIYGNYFLPDGQYKWVIAARESNNDQQNPVITDAATIERIFNVVNAPKEALSLSISKPSITQEETSTVDVKINSPSFINAFNGVISFDPNVISVTNVTEGSFFKSKGETAFNYSVDNITGEISVNVSLKDSKVASGQGVLLSFTIKGRLPGDAKLYFKEGTVADKDEDPVISVFNPSYATVEKARNPWDLSRDKKVDEGDLAVFESAFGSEPKDPNYLPLADFNMDGVIDGKDLVLLMIHFGETYP